MVDNVIVAIGVEPNTQLAEKSDLEIDPDLGGFLVNTELQARSNVYIVSKSSVNKIICFVCSHCNLFHRQATVPVSMTPNWVGDVWNITIMRWFPDVWREKT